MKKSVAKKKKTKKAKRPVFKIVKKIKKKSKTVKVKRPSKKKKALSKKQIKLARKHKLFKVHKKIKAKIKPTFVLEEIKEPSEERIWNLINKGRGRGFITEVELNSVFQRPERYLDLYEGFLDIMEKNGLSLVENESGLLGNRENYREILKEFQGEQPDMATPFDLGQISTDSIQMYLC